MAVLLWVGIVLGIVGQCISSLGLVLQKKAHTRNDAKPVAQQVLYIRNWKYPTVATYPLFTPS